MYGLITLVDSFDTIIATVVTKRVWHLVGCSFGISPGDDQRSDNRTSDAA